jgi:uncharacterized protein
MTAWWYPWLFVASFAAGFVDSIAGGGGLITVPMLLSAGLTPAEALGTNKLQAVFGSGSATWHFAQGGFLEWRQVRLGMGLACAAAALGAAVVQRIRAEILRRFIPVLLIGIGLYVLLQPRFGQEKRPARLPPWFFTLVFGLGLGFYDGFFGPGTGSFWALACVALMGLELTRATAYSKAMNFASNAGALVVFLAGGQVWFGVGLLMGVGQWAGARLGSRLVIKRGVRFIRPVFITVVLLLALRLLFGTR